MSAESRPTILVVDDNRENLTVMGGILEKDYRVRVANSGSRALIVADSEPRPDLILLDIMMPGMDGYETLAHLRRNPHTQATPVIFVTAMDTDQDEEAGLHLGAVDYVTKPIRPSILLARIATHLELKAARDRLANQNEFLEDQVIRRTRELELIKDVSMHALAMLAEKRDNETGNHLVRTQGYIELLMAQMHHMPEYASHLGPQQRKLIAKAAPLHDIGKVGIPDHILLKPGKLTPEEFEIMKQHAQIGADALDGAIQRVLASDEGGHSDSNPHYALAYLEVARDIAGCHHEKWDGSGYPRGLSGEQIPLSARLMALADVFDALSCRRHYKKAFPMDETISIIRQGRGKHFDPTIVDIFLSQVDDFIAVSERYRDQPEAI